MRPNTQAGAAPDLADRRRQIVNLFASPRVLILIIGVAVVLRLGSALFQGNVVADLPGIFDQQTYHKLAQRLIAGYGFSFAEDYWPATRAGEPTAHWSYLYTLYLAAVYALVGVQPVVARIIQAVIVGILHPWLAWRIGRRIFGPPTGLLAAAITAVYIYFVYYAGGLLTEPFYIIGILWAFDAAFRLLAHLQAAPDAASSGAPPRLWLELGLALGLVTLLRQIFLLFVPFLFLWLWWNHPVLPDTARPAKISRAARWPALKGMIITGLIILLLMMPWTIRNYQAFGTFVPLNTNAGFAFFWGNHPIYGTRFIPILPADGPSYQDLIPADLKSLNEAELDRALLRQGIQFVVTDPHRYLLLSISRIPEYFKFWPSPQSSTLSNISRVASFGLFLPFMLYGLWRSFFLVRKPDRRGQRQEIILLYLFIAIYTLLHLLTWTLIRYRLPVDAVLLIFAAYGLQHLAERLAGNRW